MADPIETWLARDPDLEHDPLPGMRRAGLLEPVADYAAIGRGKAVLVERTGRLGIGGVWGGRQLVFRHFLGGFGSAAQQAAWSGRALSVAISEPEVGAHPKLLSTRAEVVGQGFRISGRKAWVSDGPSADAIIVFAITGQDRGRKRYSAFLVPSDTPGLGFEEMAGFHALRPSRHCLLTLEGAVVPAAAMLGAEGGAYEAMALPFRDIEDAVGTFGTLGALRHAVGLFAGAGGATQAAGRGTAPLAAAGPGSAAGPGAAEIGAELGAIVALVAVLQAGAEAVVGRLDSGPMRTGEATLVGLRILAIEILGRVRAQALMLAPGVRDRLAGLLADLDATLSIARGARLARQVRLGEAALRGGAAGGGTGSGGTGSGGTGSGGTVGG
ncbi:acyl-CoA dehydrogenase family protein [Rhodopila sp.]|uniref:acyl-CoA dehydrogenase family protein n=1 Tax=Rhodopila sp. TaxID=2480087 RepID=UPI003D0B5890